MCKWVQILYTEFYLKIQNNGHFADEKINVSRGIHQGGPASNGIFLAVAEILAKMIRADQRISGVWVHEFLQLVNQFADDMGVCLDGSQQSLDATIEKFTQFQISTGFTLSYEKTTMYRVGSLRHSNAKLYTEKELNWVEDDVGFKLLGVQVSNDQEKCTKDNYEETIKKASDVLQSWRNRNISLFGKINVINTLVSSLFVYRMSVLPSMSSQHVNMINQMCQKYLWNGHRPKIKLSSLTTSKELGGAGMVDFERKDAALKATWIRNIMDDVYPHELVISIIKSKIGKMIWSCNLHWKDVDNAINTTNKFWRDVVIAWTRYHYTEVNDSHQILWLNSNIKSGNKVLWNETAYQNGLVYVSDLYSHGKLKTDSVVAEEYQITKMEFNVMKSAIPKQYKEYAKNNDESQFTDSKFQELMHTKRPTKLIYDELDTIPDEVMQKEMMWYTELKCETYIAEEMSRVRALTVVQKYRSFQYRLMMKAIVTNIHLQHWQIKDSETCTWCGEDRETYEHIFAICPYVQPIWEEARKITERENYSAVVDLTYPAIVCNKIAADNTSVTNLLCLIAKQYLYAERCLNNKPCYRKYRSKVYEVKNTEKYYAIKEQSYAKYVNKWE